MTFVAQLRTGPQANPRRPRDAQRPPCLGETLLPKKQALPIASDALSSVAYAPDEILLMLGIAGAAFAYTHSWKVALGVVFVMVVVVASYRQNVHAYPSGGGDYEVATANLGPRAGLTHQGRQFLLKDEPGGQEIRAHQQQCTPRPGRRIVYRAAPVITDADVLIRPLRNPPVTRQRVKHHHKPAQPLPIGMAVADEHAVSDGNLRGSQHGSASPPSSKRAPCTLGRTAVTARITAHVTQGWTAEPLCDSEFSESSQVDVHHFE